MREIGGYIELDEYKLPMLHEEAISLNCARNALAYILRARQIKKIRIPKFLCDSVKEVCEREQVEISYYSIDMNFYPKDMELSEDEWLYLVNYYGQIENSKINLYLERYKRIIVDNVQAYFQMPLMGVDTIYTCRKFFGVADGAFLYTDKYLDEDLKTDESYERMRFLHGRYERSASEFYNEYSANNDMFSNEPIKQMSRLTKNLLHALAYEEIKDRRTENYKILHDALKDMNQLKLSILEGPFMYPLYCKNGKNIRKKLQEKKIYIPTLWPDVFEYCDISELEYDMADNILPLPVDQRYDKEDMHYIVEKIKRVLKDLCI